MHYIPFTRTYENQFHTVHLDVGDRRKSWCGSRLPDRIGEVVRLHPLETALRFRTEASQVTPALLDEGKQRLIRYLRLSISV